ncbi:hypothetical protein EC2730450_0327 [Escherichia coli 2730450]|nr:hypothetical protein ECBCE019MS13_2157 [Escherichia coli BCE019_MS-13]ENA85054.1 hypothetical protein EC2730450_0327 [Escherichia coli 2730450]ENB35456.1 hypothetical protein ECBCE032MS12_2160 [Escherichia coli BCE032_MS-12]KEO10343.1 hypothetical protein AB37_2090 [Escherichia coli 8-415-05_S1_C2]
MRTFFCLYIHFDHPFLFHVIINYQKSNKNQDIYTFHRSRKEQFLMFLG